MVKATYKNIPSKEEIDKRFEELIDGNYDDLTIEQTLKIVDNKLGILPHINKVTTSEILFVRARKDINECIDDISDVSIFSNPPANVTKEARANIEGHPVFYASIGQMQNVFMEVDANAKDTVYVSIWKKPEGIEIRKSMYIFSDLPKENIFKNWNDDINNYINEHILEGDKEAFLYVLKKYHNLFLCPRTKCFPLTSKIAHNLLYGNMDKTDAIIYPSIPNNKKDLNIAIHPEYVKNNLKLLYVLKTTLQSDDSGYFFINAYGQYDIASGKINWKQPFEKEDAEKIYNESGIRI